MDLFSLVRHAAEVPFVQGIIVAAVTQAVKRAPVGPVGGPGVRAVAAILALASAVATSAATGNLAELDAEEVVRQAVDALGAFLAAVGAWELTRKDRGNGGPPPAI